MERLIARVGRFFGRPPRRLNLVIDGEEPAIPEEEWHRLMATVTGRVGSRAAEIARPKCLLEVREHPFERAIAEGLHLELPVGYAARTGGRPGLADFPRLGNYDISVSTGPTEAAYEAVAEFKKWGPPGPRGGPPDKRHETLWDVLKLACTIAAGKSGRGYLVVLAPIAAWGLEHDFNALFDGGEWTTRELCERNPTAMVFFGDDHYGVTRAPVGIATSPIHTEVVTDPRDGQQWALRTLAIEPRGPSALLVRADAPPSPSAP